MGHQTQAFALHPSSRVCIGRAWHVDDGAISVRTWLETRVLFDNCDVVAAGRVLCPLLGHPAVNAAWARWKQRVAKDPDTEQEGREVCQKRLIVRSIPGLREAIARGEAAALTERELHDAKEALAREERRERARVAIAEAVSCTLRQF